LQPSSGENYGQDFNPSLPAEAAPKPPVPRRLAKSSTAHMRPLRDDQEIRENLSEDQSISLQRSGDLLSKVPGELPPPIPKKPASLTLQGKSKNNSDMISESRDNQRSYQRRLEETPNYRPPLPARVDNESASFSPKDRVEYQPWQKVVAYESPHNMGANESLHLLDRHGGPLRNFLDEADEPMKDWKPLIPRREIG
jgi:hypothetical protein